MKKQDRIYIWKDKRLSKLMKTGLIVMALLLLIFIYLSIGEFSYLIILVLLLIILIAGNFFKYTPKLNKKSIILKRRLCKKELLIPLSNINKILIYKRVHFLLPINVSPYHLMIQLKNRFSGYDVNLIDKEGFMKSIKKTGFNKFKKIGPLMWESKK